MMQILPLLADAGGGGQVGEIARSFGVDWTHLIAQVISFCIVCVLLQRYAYKPVLAVLEARRQRIAEGLANADKIKAELADVEVRRREVMQEASAHATRLIDEARAAAARVQAEETRKAAIAAEQILVKTREAAAREHDRVLEDLKREVGRLVVQTTAALIGRTLTPEDQERLAAETLAAMDGGAGGAPATPRWSTQAAAGQLLRRQGTIGVGDDASDQTSAARR